MSNLMSNLSALYAATPVDDDAVRARLSRLGFADARRAQNLMQSFAKTESERTALLPLLDALMNDLGESSDPERALVSFSRLCDALPTAEKAAEDSTTDRAAFFRLLQDQPDLRARLTQLFSFSQTLTDDFVRRPQESLVIAQSGLLSRPALRQRAEFAVQSASGFSASLDALRRFKREETLRLALFDLEEHTWRDEAVFSRLVRSISDMAQVCVETCLDLVAQDLGMDTAGFCVVGMGKLGARELNYSSDIDLIFLYEGEAAPYRALGERLLKALSEPSREGVMFRVDTRLRPDGGSGPLVTPLGYAFNYYESYAGAWEHQALIKARVVAGDARLGRRFEKFVRGIVWSRRPDDAHLREVVRLKRRAEAQAEGRDPRNVKTGPGGIRDAEWVAQFIQLMVGPAHPRARASATLRALEVLRDLQALSSEEETALHEGYLFFRVVEHRLQLRDEKAIRVLPQAPAEQAALARRMGYQGRGESAVRWLREEVEYHQKDVRALCERLFHDFDEGGDAPTSGTRTTEQATALSPDAQTRLTRLSEGTITRPLPAPLARQVRAALPGALQGLEFAADPERAVANLERLCDASGNRLSLLRSLDDAPNLSRAVLTILGGSEALSDTLIQFPQLLDLAANRALLAAPHTWEEARAECRAYCLSFQDQRAAVRRWKRREMLRIGLRDLVLNTIPHEITGEISNLAQACLQVAEEAVRLETRPFSDRIAFATLGMGKLGGGEMHYASDCDVIWAYQSFETESNPELGAHARRGAETITQFLGERTAEGIAFEVDARLRPMGNSGPLCPPLPAFAEYFERGAGGLAIWERQALTRTRYVAGDRATSARLTAMIRDVAHPETWQPQWSDELRHIKARVEKERAARGSQSAQTTVYDVKLGRGGIADIEWSAQWLALKHGFQFPALQVPNTRRQLEAARDAELLPEDDALALLDAHTFLRRAELRLQVTQERSAGAVKAGTPQFAHWARSVYSEASSQEATEQFSAAWGHYTEAAHRAFERVREGV